MISAVLYREGENLNGCQLKGHSGRGYAGHDIVCAAVSILGCTCVNSLVTVCGVIPEVIQNDEGILTFHLPEMTEEEKDREFWSLCGCWKDDPEDAARMESAIKDFSLMPGVKCVNWVERK